MKTIIITIMLLFLGTISNPSLASGTVSSLENSSKEQATNSFELSKDNPPQRNLTWEQIAAMTITTIVWFISITSGYYPLILFGKKVKNFIQKRKNNSFWKLFF